jgi:eukaryotic-like serine/threonine-protein kinase
MLNQVLQNRYKVTARLGKGAMGEVFRAADQLTGQEVALKVIASELAVDQAILERFQREGEALRQLRHRNIVAFVDMFGHQGQHCIVMEYVPGGNLHALIAQGPLPLARAREIALDLCDALICAHRLNIIHRDLKPENVLLTAEGTPKLTDFGVARLLAAGTRLTGTGTQVGTPYYMSPEAWEGRPLDAQADVWSLGVVLYEMLTGQVPFGGETAAVVMNKVLAAPLPDLKTLRAEAPDALIKIIERALVRDKSGRYRTMRMMSVDLEACSLSQDGQPPPTLPPTAVVAVSSTETPGERLRPVGPRPLPLVGAGALALMALLVAVGLGVWAVGKSLAPTPPGIADLPTVRPSPVASNSLLAATATRLTRLTATHTHVLPVLTVSPTLRPPTMTPVQVLDLGSTSVSDKDSMTLVYVPAGEFRMGSPDLDEKAPTNEKPQHSVFLEAYWIDQTEVTNAMFAKFVEAEGRVTTAEKEGCGTVTEVDSSYRCWTGVDWRHPRGPGTTLEGRDNHPVVQVSWYDASAYCEWAGRRLPTEAEWEKAARGTDGRIYPWGNRALTGKLLNFADMHLKTDWADLTTDDGYTFTAPVGSYPAGASPYGVLDLAGNVDEWVADWYDASYFGRSPGRNPPGPANGERRVIRGGNWIGGNWSVQVMRRTSDWENNRNDIFGFRCARTP